MYQDVATMQPMLQLRENKRKEKASYCKH